MEFSGRRAVLVDAIDTALRGLATVPQDANVVRLIGAAQRLRHEVDAWDASGPPEAQIADAETRALSLHVAVAEVRRDEGTGS